MGSVHPSLYRRKIIHVDMDAFYASIEVLDEPRLSGKPLVVGGRPDSRGVVCTASYEARVFGVRSAMACAKAARLCPEAIFVPPRFERYRAVSEAIRAIFRRYTDLVEPLSLDEAYLDVTDNSHKLYAVEIAKRIRADIWRECRLTASAGVAPNKMLAKIASDLNKPNGLAVILPDQVADFVRPLALARIHGIGPVTAAKLAGHGLETCGQVTAEAEAAIIGRFGAHFGAWLYERAHGLDDRPVEPTRLRKSFGQEETFAKDLSTREQMTAALTSLGTELAATLQEAGRKGRTITLKVRYPDFRICTRAASLPVPTQAPERIVETAIQLLDKTEALARRVRLLGISLSKLDEWADSEADAPAAKRSGALYTQRTLFGD